jgi:glucosamine 6-phosphate synthetase-like amidotransferase/phosphosugar isomerase protein
MCGIVGLFLKDPSLEPTMGEMLTAMLVTMSDRGPDSAGVAIYGAGEAGDGQADGAGGCARGRLRDIGQDADRADRCAVRLTRNDTHAVLHLDARSMSLPPVRCCARCPASGS